MYAFPKFEQAKTFSRLHCRQRKREERGGKLRRLGQKASQGIYIKGRVNAVRDAQSETALPKVDQRGGVGRADGE